jgi:curved DNA-binding protein CbpA
MDCMSEGHHSDFVDYYELLGVQPDAEVAFIRKVYIRQAKENHPDAGGSTEIMQQLNVAYKTLTSPTAKAAYDMLHSFHTGQTQTDYKYADGREVNDVTDMSDDEIDEFLDSLLKEYRSGPPKAKQSVRRRFKRLFTFDI